MKKYRIGWSFEYQETIWKYTIKAWDRQDALAKAYKILNPQSSPLIRVNAEALND